jgi:hypothetical protein
VTTAFGIHLLTLASAPAVAWVLWRHFRRHRDPLALAVGSSGAMLLTIHLMIHLTPGAEVGLPLPFTLTDQVGAGLLIVGVALDWRAARRWMRDQRRKLMAIAEMRAAVQAVYL